MNRRFLIGLAPLFAIAAVAVMPVAAQAVTQHWYKNGPILEAGPENTTAVVTFGGETNLSQNSAIGTINCRGVGGGTIENPVGGGAGTGKTNSASFYECKAPECEAAVAEKFGTTGRGTAVTENNPAATKEPAFPGWTNVLEESTVGGVSSIREKIGEPFVTFKTPSPPGMIRATVNCEIAPTKTVIISARFEGELKPEIGAAKLGNTNGSSAAKPSFTRFSGPSTGALHSEIGGEGTNAGNVKFMGMFEEETLTVKP